MGKKGEIKTQEKFVQDVKDRHGDKYTILGDYRGGNEKILVRYNKCGHEMPTKACNIIAGKGCPICKKGVRLSKEEVEYMLQNKYKGEYLLAGEYTSNRTTMSVLHDKCNLIFPVNAGAALYRDCNCPKCFPNKSKILFAGINDIATTNQTLFNLLKNKEDGYKYRENSKKKTWFTCPCCGNDIYATITNVNIQGLGCNVCGKGMSYAERFMADILRKLDIKYKSQYSPKWVKPFRYDFYFKYNNQEYIVEMDGGFHFEDNALSGLTAEEAKQRDEYKDKLATDHGICVIRIDCDYKSCNRNEYIKNNIIHSKLYNLLNLSDEFLSQSATNAERYIMLDILEQWNNGIKVIEKICQNLNISVMTVRRYLYIASDNGIIKESRQEIKNINRDHKHKMGRFSHHIRVLCNETGEIFNTFKEAQIKYNANLSNYFRDERRKYSGTLPDGTRLTWTKLN